MTRPPHLRDLCEPCVGAACAGMPAGPVAESARLRLARPGALEEGTCDCCGDVAPTLLATEDEVARARAQKEKN